MVTIFATVVALVMLSKFIRGREFAIATPFRTTPFLLWFVKTPFMPLPISHPTKRIIAEGTSVNFRHMFAR